MQDETKDNSRAAGPEIKTVSPATRSAASKTIDLRGFSFARKLMLTALALHFVSLFFAYVDANSDGVEVKVYVERWHVEPIRGGNPEVTGFKLLPYAKYVILGLFALFATNFYEEKLWRRFGYWISFALLIKFAYGGAPFRTLGGKMATVCLLMVLVAAYLNHKELKMLKAKVPPPPTLTDDSGR